MDDLISRKAAIDSFDTGLWGVEWDKALATAMLKDLPSAQPEKQRGEWIRHTRVKPVYSIDGVETWGIKCQCNKCCFTTTVVEDFGYYNFCPHCGADMRGEQDG